jgi:penicillin-binding protein 1C
MDEQRPAVSEERRDIAPKPRAKKSLAKLAWKTLCAFLVLILAGWLALKFVPIPAALERPAVQSMELVDRNGETLRERSVDAQFVRHVSLPEVPQLLIDALLAAEDKRFFDHHGIDFLATARAARDSLMRRRIVSGASTITQQLVKVAHPRPRTYRTKVIENVTALRLEQLWSKERILEEYLNRVDFGHMNIGVAAAADFYFGKPLRDLSPAEAAFLAGLPKNPRRLNPHRSPAAARSRRNVVLRRMRDNGTLAVAEFERAIAEPPRLREIQRTFNAPHFVDLVLREIGMMPGRVATTLDLDLTRFAELRLREQIAQLRGTNATNGAVVVIENGTGSIRALVGSENYFAPGTGQVNGALARRSPGSTIKPFTYLLALERGATPATIYADVPTVFTTAGGTYQVDNYQRRCSGPVSLRRALGCSLNIPAVRALDSLGGPQPLQRRLSDLGFTTLDRAPTEYGLGLTLGNAEAKLIELANAYAALARMGEYRPWRVLAAETPAPGRLVADARACWLMADILSDNEARTDAFGANSPLRFDFPAACKTGTSTDYRDNWALGYTPEFTVGVWVGNFSGAAMRGVSGVSGAAPLMHAVLEHLHTRFGTSWFTAPPGIVEAEVHPLTGHRVASGGVRERFLGDHLPPMESPADYDAQGQAILGPEYAQWLASPEGNAGTRAAVPAHDALRIVSPAPGTTFVIDPDLPTSRRVPLLATGASSIRWESDSMECHDNEAILTEGDHKLFAIDPSTGARAETWIRVKQL